MSETTGRRNSPFTGYPFRSWVDDDGRHAWTEHECNGARERTMLPWPQWHVVGDRIEPSIWCEACGAHYFGRVTRTSNDFRVNAAFGIYDDPLDPTVVDFGAAS